MTKPKSQFSLAFWAVGIATGCNAVLGLEELPRVPKEDGRAAGGASGVSANGGTGGTHGEAATGPGGAGDGATAGTGGSGRGAEGGSSDGGHGGSDSQCGDGAVDGTEACDDGGTARGDGCSASCEVEDGWSCEGSNPSVCSETCGDGAVIGRERLAGGCDDGDVDSEDGCDSTCRVSPGWFCSGEPSTCTQTCGNGVIEGSEICDDGDLDDGDGCDACTVEPGWNCNGGEPTVCADINECDNGTDNCHANASCTNTAGSFTCECVAGYAGSGVTCLPVVVAVETGSEHTCALIGSGTVRCWGAAGNGRLGYGNSNMIGDNEPPSAAGDVPVGGLVRQLAIGTDHTCALLTSGAVRCWGNGLDGQLGYGDDISIGDDETPASVGDVNVGATVQQIATGAGHTCVLLSTGAVRCWGYGLYGQLGYGNTSNAYVPASRSDINIGGAVRQIVAGGSFTCALLTTGSVRCWGEGRYGVLGYGNTNNIGDNETPASAGDVTVGGTVQRIAASNSHTCALLTTGAVRCWGLGTYGRLGYGNTSDIGDNETPASAGDINFGGTAQDVDAGARHTCVLLTSGALRCWGDGSSGRLGYGNTNAIGDNESPVGAGDVPVGGTVRSVSTPLLGGHTCAVLSTGAVRCWGSGLSGRLGYGNIDYVGDDETPASAGDVPVL